MMLMKRLFMVPLLLLIIWFLTGCGLSKEIYVSTEPVNAEVWLDGEHIGETPMKLPINLNEDRKIELVAEGFLRVGYELREDLPSMGLDIRLFPRRFSRNLSVSGVISYFDRGGILVDWLYWDGGYREDLYDQAEATNFRESWSESSESNGGVPYLVLINPVFANDGHHIAFQEAEFPAPKCGIVPTQLWLTTLQKPEEKELVLEVLGGNIPLCERSHGFSNDSSWLWVVYEEKLGTEEYVLRLIDVDDPLNHQVVLSKSSIVHVPQWSQDGKRLAFELANGSTGIFYLENGIWEAVETEISGKPVGWSPENDEVWMLNDSIDGNTHLQVYNIASSELFQEYDLGGIEVETSGLKFSPDGKHFALVYRSEIIHEDEERIVEKVLIGNREAEDLLVFEDLDYKLFLYWLEDNERIAVLAEDENGKNVMKILTFQTDN